MKRTVLLAAAALVLQACAANHLRTKPLRPTTSTTQAAMTSSAAASR